LSELTHDDVREILDLIDRAQSDFFQLQMGDLKLLVSKTAPPGATPPGTPAAVTPNPAPAPAAPALHPGAPSTPPAVTAQDRAGLIEVRAPMVGTFYAQSEPGAPPFVQVGSVVDQDATLGLIEVMKVYTAIRAGTTGAVVEILTGNAQFVEYGQVLFYIRPAAGP